jgi:hypothetical protein
LKTFRRSWSLLVALLCGCVDPIHVATVTIGGELVISGQISTLEDQSSLTIGTTADTDRLPYPVSAATVVIYENGDSVGTYIESPTSPGQYTLKNRTGIPGKIYQIRVSLADGKSYWSTPEKMPAHAGTVTSYYEHGREEYVDEEGTLSTKNFLKVYANAVLPSHETQYFRWVVEEVYTIVVSSPPGAPVTSPPCFVTQLADPQYFVLMDRGNLFVTEVPDKLVAQRLVDETFMYKHYLITYQSALTAEAYDYWRKVDILVSGNGSLFDPPPARIYGNIIQNDKQGMEKVFGYFQATNQAVSRIFTRPQDFPYYLNFSDCQSSFPPMRCTDCLSVRNSSHDRPSWF